jgi:hypothetical protein
MHSDGIIAVDAVLNSNTGQTEVWLKIKTESCFLSADEACALADAVDSRQAIEINRVSVGWSRYEALRVTLGTRAAHPAASLFLADWLRQEAEKTMLPIISADDGQTVEQLSGT